MTVKFELKIAIWRTNLVKKGANARKKICLVIKSIYKTWENMIISRRKFFTRWRESGPKVLVPANRSTNSIHAIIAGGRRKGQGARQHCRLSICGHFGWVWQILSEANPSINWWWDEQICIWSLCLTNPVKTRIEQDTSIEYNKSAHYLVGCHQVTPAPVWSFWVSSPFFLTKLFNVGEAYFPQNYPWTKCQM